MDYYVKIFVLLVDIVKSCRTFLTIVFHLAMLRQFILEDIEQSLGPNGHSSRDFFASAYAYTPGEQAEGSSSYDSIF